MKPAMAFTPAEYALRRALDYLVSWGRVPADDLVLAVLVIIEEEMRRHPGDVIARVLSRLPDEFNLQAPGLPLAQPPLLRGSIGYK